jgi:hypothetical protein
MYVRLVILRSNFELLKIILQNTIAEVFLAYI